MPLRGPRLLADRRVLHGSAAASSVECCGYGRRARVHGSVSLPDALEEYPVIAEAIRSLHVAERMPFSGWHVLAIQHVHSSLVVLLDAICFGGADVSQITVVGKSYSTRRQAMNLLRGRGARVIDPLRMRDPCQSFEVELGERVASVIEEFASVRESDSKGLLILDEGAVASHYLVGRPDLAGRVRAVEQTTRGARWLDSVRLGYPVVDVARSAAKAELEAPMVAGSMVAELSRVLAQFGTKLSQIGIVGYGTMGARLASLLAHDHTVYASDIDDSNAARARADGLEVHDFATLANEVQLVIGCTGNGIITEADLPRFDRELILVNGASSDIEFKLWGRINFHCPGEPLTPQQFQLTRALMLAGAVQVIESEGTGLAPLNGQIQGIITAAYLPIQARLAVTT